MKNDKTPLELGRRERQIVETVTRLGEGSVAEVLRQLEDPPTYSTVRAMLGVLVEKKWLKVRQSGKRYLYRPAVDGTKTRRRAIDRLLHTFFAGSPADALASLLDSTADKLSVVDLKRMTEMIERAKREKQ